MLPVCGIFNPYDWHFNPTDYHADNPCTVLSPAPPPGSEADGGLLGLPETENELDNLTEFNTAQNRRISTMGIPKEETFVKKRRKIHITFNEEEDVINPEDVDPSIGRKDHLSHPSYSFSQVGSVTWSRAPSSPRPASSRAR